MEVFNSENGYYIGIDVGTTNIRACLFDTSYNLLFFEEERVNIICSTQNELAEMDPDELWSQLCLVLSRVVRRVSDPNLIISTGLCCQRNTFISWDVETQKPCHRLVTWKDGRGKVACENYNKSLRMKLLNLGGSIAYFFTGSERFKSAKILKFVNAMVTHRFLVTLEKNEKMKKLLEQKRLAVGCLDTWILSRFTNGRVFITEPSSISSTGLFDPFFCEYGKTILRFVGFPQEVMLPQIVDTTKINVMTEPTILDGVSLKIGASLGDAQSAAFGSGCHSNGALSICLGTGTFFDLVAGEDPRFGAISQSGLFPLVGWRIGGKCKFLVEAHMNCSATVIDWAHNVGILESIEKAAEIAESAEYVENLHFIPGFDGIQTLVDDEYACGGLLGVNATTTKEQIVRALLESIAFNVAQMYDACRDELNDFYCSFIRVCGGVSSNDFLCQQMANLLNFPIERVTDNHFCASKGAAFLAGIASGNIVAAQVTEYVKIDRVFIPQSDEKRAFILKCFEKWKNSQKRCLHFYNAQRSLMQGSGANKKKMD